MFGLSVFAEVVYYIGIIVFAVAMIAVINRTFNALVKDYNDRQEMYEEGILVRK